MSDKFKISDLNSDALRQLAANVDKFGGDNNGSISKKEFKHLQSLLNGDEYKSLQVEFTNEKDEIKKLFGYTGSVQAAMTTPVAENVSDEDDAVADNTQPEKSKEEQVKDAYYRYRGIDPVTRKPLTDASGQPVKGLSPKAAYEAVEKLYKGQKEYKDAVKDLEDYSIDTEAKTIVIDAISRTTATDSKKVKKEAEEILKREGNWDKHTKKALNGKGHSWIKNRLGWLSGQDSDMKLIRKAQAAGNNAENVANDKTHTKKDFTDAIGKKCPLFKEDGNGEMVIEKLTGTGQTKDIKLVTKNADGTYDISKLVEFIGSQIGADNTMNRQQNSAESELEKIRAEFRKQGVELTKRDTKQLVEFCGYRVERKNYSYVLYRSTVGALAGAAGTAVTAGGKYHEHTNLDFVIKSEQASKLELDKIQGIDEEALQIINNGSSINIKIDQKKVMPMLSILSANNIPLALLKSAAVGAGVELALATLEYGPSEKAVFSTNIEPCQSYEDFIAYVDARKELTDAQKLALKQIAIAYIKENDDGSPKTVVRKDGEGKPVLDKNGEPVKELAWDQKAFIDYLNKSSGFASDFNKIELYKAVAGAGEIVSNCDCDCDEVVNDEVEEDEETETDEECKDCETKVEPGKKFEVKPPEVKFRSWQDLVNGYDCLKPYNKVIKGVALNNRMVKVIQAIDVSNVKSDAELKQVYNIKTIAAFAEDAIKFGIDKAIASHPELPVNKSEYLSVVGATAGLSGNAYVPALYDPDTGDTCDWSKKANAQITKGTGRGTTATLTRKGHTLDGQPTYWRKCPGGNWEQIDKETYEALQK